MCVILIAIIIVASLSETPSRRRYLIAAWSFAILSFGSVLIRVFPLFFDIQMANAFGPRSMSSAAYIFPIFVILAFGYPALSLFPFMSAETGRKVVLAIVGLVVLWSTFLFLRTMIRWPQSQGGGPVAAIMAYFYLLLWWRVYDLRRATDEST